MMSKTFSTDKRLRHDQYNLSFSSSTHTVGDPVAGTVETVVKVNS